MPPGFYVNAVTMVKDEADIIEATVSHMCEQASFVLVADNGSTDGTWEILQRLDDEHANLWVERDEDPAYYQSRKMTALAHEMMVQAAFIVPFDADEIWLARDGRRIRDVLRDLPEDVLLAEAELYDHVATALDPAIVTDSIRRLPDDPISHMGWRRPEPAPLPKVAVRAREGLTIHQGNHGATFPSTDHPPTIKNLLCVRHFALRSPQQMIRKARNGGAAYAATTLPEDVGAHWRGWNQLSDEQIEEVFRRYYWSGDPEADGLVFDPVG